MTTKQMNRTARRDVLKDVRYIQTTHPGLWLDRYLSQQIVKGETVEDETSYAKLMKEAASIGIPAEYRAFFKRWEEALRTYPESHIREAQTTGRLVVGLGSESTTETAITLHRTYGIPYIPGSALKGLVAHCARNFAQQEIWGGYFPDPDDMAKQKFVASEHYQALFGDTTTAGYVTFFDALPVPNQTLRLAPDIITVHHPLYYRGENEPPADWDSPIPIPLLCATGTFLIALAGPTDWVEVTYDILRFGLHTLGIGAKTSSGYGRLDFR